MNFEIMNLFCDQMVHLYHFLYIGKIQMGFLFYNLKFKNKNLTVKTLSMFKGKWL